MDDRRRTLAAVTVLAGFVALVVIGVGAIVSGKKVVSPVPDEGAIRIIFITPTPTQSATPSATPTVKTTPRKDSGQAPTATPTP